MGPSSFHTRTASFANSSQRHQMSKLPPPFLQFLEVKRQQNMPGGIPTAQIPVVTGGLELVLLTHVCGADIYTQTPHLADKRRIQC